MTRGDIKLYLICGIGFFIDAYDLFIINLVTPIWQYEYVSLPDDCRTNSSAHFRVLPLTRL